MRAVSWPYNAGRPHRALALLSPAGSDQRNQPSANAIERHDLLGGLIHEYRAAVSARCERTAVQRCRARFVKRRELRLAMPILAVAVRRGRAVGWLCKPEVTGSIPVRSTPRSSKHRPITVKASGLPA